LEVNRIDDLTIRRIGIAVARKTGTMDHVRAQ
jgi:hypothetical protein